MKRLKEWIRNWIRQWLGVEIQAQQISSVRKKWDSVDESCNNLYNMYESVRDENRRRLRDIESCFHLGVDVNYKGRSWAVLCYQDRGKRDIVKHIAITDSCAQEIERLIRHMGPYSNKRIDEPHRQISRSIERDFNGKFD